MDKPKCLSKQNPKELLENITSDVFKDTHDIIDQNPEIPEINLTSEYCYGEYCMQTGICIYSKRKNHFLNNNYMVLN